ncbi:antibiotic biosynthesis monooxygenase family protein [Cytophagaceae bacterium YF14B1]|uniref:Antibiotic biosynthesis monooxygenase family protein n=1 Tax=Xanthocytophaga flava TaxID=3048013 RepID=A0AAE3QTA8_9BACT|nr:antibiotic biosynthesis monooxygenase family protein [Xanthocytophaga flavus]MDJ1485025.1 antibiotic biosynthesis monooxygenase family protein [Xanthocytophaga flavus]
MRKNRKIALTAEINILNGFESEVLFAAKKVWEATRKEEGCEMFLLNTRKERTDIILFYEVFKTQEAFDAHVCFDHTVAFLNFLKGKVVGNGPALTFLDQYSD